MQINNDKQKNTHGAINLNSILCRVLISIFVAGSLSACLTKSALKQKFYQPTPPVVVTVKRMDNGAIYQIGMRVGLFDDMKARRVGDILTVILEENTNASALASTTATKENKIDLGGPTLAGDKVTQEGKEILNNEIDAGREFSGQGTSTQNHVFNGVITVTVAEVLPNHNLVVRGEKLIVLNQSDEYIRMSGIVRPSDIKPDNTVSSTKVANVHIAYSGQGTISDANSMGSLGRFFQSSSWPY